MAEPPDDENEKEDKTGGDEESGGEKGGTAGGGPVGFFGDQYQQESKRRDDTDDGSGTSVKGTYRRPGSAGDIKLTTDQQKTVWTDFRRLDLSGAVSAIAEFFSEFPARASANMSVDWGSVKGIAIVNLSIKFGQDVAMAVRERTRESAVSVKRRYGLNIQVARRGQGQRANTAPPVNPKAG